MEGPNQKKKVEKTYVCVCAPERYRGKKKEKDETHTHKKQKKKALTEIGQHRRSFQLNLQQSKLLERKGLLHCHPCLGISVYI